MALGGYLILRRGLSIIRELEGNCHSNVPLQDSRLEELNFSLVFHSSRHFSSSGGLSPSSRDSIDPIADLLAQLSGVRRPGGGAGSNSSAPSQLQQLQMQLQLDRQQGRVRMTI